MLLGGQHIFWLPADITAAEVGTGIAIEGDMIITRTSTKPLRAHDDGYISPRVAVAAIELLLAAGKSGHAKEFALILACGGNLLPAAVLDRVGQEVGK